MYLNDECLGGGYVSDFFCSLKSHMKELGLYVSSKRKTKQIKKLDFLYRVKLYINYKDRRKE